MSRAYTLDAMKCAHCGKIHKYIYYAPQLGHTTFKCERCGKMNKVVKKYYAKKID